ncbi:MAG: Rid family detoxifying hydrolase [Gemmatimonadetes bacterium]|nr:Rid family detoxifying hydrolase [Gemmatimonadota bacterium]
MKPVTARLATLAVALAMVACGAPDPAPDAPPEMRSAEPRGALAEIEHIHPEGVARLPVFTPAVRVGDLIFLSGAIGTKPDELALVEGGIRAETQQTLENIRTVLHAAGADLEDVVKCSVFLADIEDYAAMNEVYGPFWGGTPPARSALAGSGLALGALVEIECIARAPGI